MAATTPTKHVVVDAGGFIRNAPIREIGEHVYTIPEVVHESCDKATRQRLQVLPYTLSFKEPSSEAISAVTDFAKKTGDYRHLSLTDIRVIALTYMLEKEHVGADHIKKEPTNKPAEYIVSNKRLEKPTDIAGFYIRPSAPVDEGQNDDKDQPESTADAAQSKEETHDPDEDLLNAESGSQQVHEPNPEKEEALTCTANEPACYDEEPVVDSKKQDAQQEMVQSSEQSPEVKRRMGDTSASEKCSVEVACLTTDFAMQNVLIQMGLNVVSVDGMLIKRAKSYVLRCIACMKITFNTSKVFCPHCGNKTLKRVAMTRDEDGTVRYYFSRRPLNTRGMKYPLPMPKGGKHAKNPVLVEDQPLPQQRASKKSQKKMDIFTPEYVTGSSPFAVNDITSRAAQLGISGKHNYGANAYWNKRNPNEARKKHGRRK
ncbi:hypothetical protein BaRGS_00004128 [Batillaria attramentaria]|uniref:RNA-binding protein NOB1 n=1 Tax=Batillaria attramentaria TaxID=370345 RepID=A0ABD0M089_9CAEN